MRYEEAIGALLKALPRCCNCQTAAATIIDANRWPLCEGCWKAVPGSDNEKPVADMRKEVQAAYSMLRRSLAESLSRIPSYSEIPPPPSAPPGPVTIDLEEFERRNKQLRMKIRRMRNDRITATKRTALFFLFAGLVLAGLLHGLLHYV